MEFVLPLTLVICAGVFGGLLAKSFKLPPLVGYIVSGIAFGSLLPTGVKGVSKLAEIGTILLLFSIGVEMNLERLSRFFKIAVIGALVQIVLVSLVLYLFLSSLGFNAVTSLILAAGFSLSSTAVVIKILSDRGELDTIHAGVMVGWLLVQDLAVVPMMVVLPILGRMEGGVGSVIFLSLVKALLVILTVVFLGKTLVPQLIHRVVAANSRELLVLSSVALALGTAALTSLLGISPSLGAFLAGVVISESQEHHAVFAEVRPLRDLFVALFFVSLGFLLTPVVLATKIGIILFLAAAVLVVKFLVVFVISLLGGYRGKTAIFTSLGLAQVGEFAFIIYSFSLGTQTLSPADTSLGIAVTLLTLIATPILFKSAVPFWRKMKDLTVKWPKLARVVSLGERKLPLSEEIKNHIVICGYGRVGGWVGKALEDFGIPFVVIDYNQKIVTELKEGGVPVIYGDPTEPEILELSHIRQAKAVILAIPDQIAQETLIAHIQTIAPDVKIISRVHQDSDWEKLKILRVEKIVQPEFEGAIEIVRSVLGGIGKSSDEIDQCLRRLRMSHSRM